MLVLTLLGISLVAGAQEWEDSIRMESEKIMMSDEWTARSASLQKMPILLENALREEGSFNMAFDSSRVSVVYAPDSSFRLLSGQAILEGDDTHYYGALQTRDQEQDPFIFQSETADTSFLGSVRGALYYNIIKCNLEARDYYILFGFRAESYFTNRKAAEVLYFDSGIPQLGAPIFFDKNNEPQDHIALTYSSDVGARLNYDTTQQMIIYDHLIPMKSPYEKDRILKVPDGSYRGYKWMDGKGWIYIEKVFDQISETAPREVPVLGNSKEKDIFGRTKNR